MKRVFNPTSRHGENTFLSVSRKSLLEMVAIFSFEQKIHSISTKSWVTQPKLTHYFSRICFPLQNHGSVGFVHFCSFLGSPYCRIRIHTSDPQLTIAGNAGRMSRPMLRAKTIGSKRCKQHNKTCVDPESNDLRIQNQEHII